MKKRFARILALGIGTPVLVILLAGLFSSKDFQGSRQVWLDAPVEKVWDLLNDVEGLPKRNARVVSVELLEKNGARPVKWRQRTDQGEEVLFETTEWKPKQRVQWTMLSSDFGMTGTWTFEITVDGPKTLLTLHEESKSEKFMTRAALVLAGRSANLKRMLQNIEDSLK